MDKSILKSVISDYTAGITKYKVNPRNIRTETIIQSGGKKIEVVPLWKWLLKE